MHDLGGRRICMHPRAITQSCFIRSVKSCASEQLSGACWRQDEGEVVGLLMSAAVQYSIVIKDIAMCTSTSGFRHDKSSRQHMPPYGQQKAIYLL